MISPKGTRNFVGTRPRAGMVLLVSVLVALSAAWMTLSPATFNSVGGGEVTCNFDALSTVFFPPDNNIGSRCVDGSRLLVAQWGGLSLLALVVAVWALWRLLLLSSRRCDGSRSTSASTH